MEIIIRSRENGWETERRLELPEDAGLVKSILRTLGACGKSYTINAREPVTETACKACGHVTALEEMAAVEMCCPDCGKTWRYKTNSEQADVSARCVSCGAVMVSEWDRKLRRYVPQKLKREDD